MGMKKWTSKVKRTLKEEGIRKSINLAISAILIPSIASSIGFVVVNNGNIAKAAPPASSTAIGDNNNNIQRQQPPPKTHEYTLIAQDTTVEIAPNIRVEPLGV